MLKKLHMQETLKQTINFHHRVTENVENMFMCHCQLSVLVFGFQICVLRLLDILATQQ